MLSDDIQSVAAFLSRYKWTGGYLNPPTIVSLVAALNGLAADAHQLEASALAAAAKLPAVLPANVVRLDERRTHQAGGAR